MSEEFWKNFFKKNDKALTFILICIVPVFLLGVDIVFTKIYRKYLANTVSNATPESEYRTRHPLFHHTLKPMAYAPRAQFGPIQVPLYTNSLGFRDFSNREVPLRTSQHRVVLMGDSFTEGVAVPFEQTYAGIVTKELASQNIEVLDGGVAKYSPIIYYRKIKYLIEEVGLKFNEVFVFIDISDIFNEAVDFDMDENGNVIDMLEHPSHLQVESETDSIMKKALDPTRRDNRMDNPKLFGLVDFIKTETSLFFVLARFTKKIIYGDQANFDLKNLQSMWTFDEASYDAYGRKGLERAKKYMDLLSNLLKSHNIALGIVVYPWPDQVFVEDLNSKQVVFWQDWADSHKTSFLNLFPAFIGQEDKITVLKKYFIKRDGHWNAAGHGLVANRFLNFYQHRHSHGSLINNGL